MTKILKKLFKNNPKYDYSMDLIDRLDRLDGYQDIILLSSKCNFYIQKGDKGVQLSDYKYELVSFETKCLSKYIYNDKKINKNSIIIFFDRINKADDNAQIMYEYFISKGYNNCYYCISNECEDYKILDNLGYNLLNYASKEFEKLYLSCDFIISSCCDNMIINYNGLRFDNNHADFSSKFIFLQHGVITDDMSSWLITKRFDKIIISTTDEYKILKKAYIDDSRIIKSGLARFDRLKNNVEDLILIAPTYRNYESTSYVFKWSEFINSTEFKRYSKNKKVVFICHPLVDKSLFNFKIEVYNSNEVKYSNYISKCSLFITDYSSIFMDILYLKKKVMFYNFDSEEFFSNHTYKMEFDYNNNIYCDSFKDGFEFVQKVNNKNIEYLNYYNESHSKKIYDELVREYN